MPHGAAQGVDLGIGQQPHPAAMHEEGSAGSCSAESTQDTVDVPAVQAEQQLRSLLDVLLGNVTHYSPVRCEGGQRRLKPPRRSGPSTQLCDACLGPPSPCLQQSHRAWLRPPEKRSST